MNTHHPYVANITRENWLDLLAVRKIDGRSINSLINEGAREVVRLTKKRTGSTQTGTRDCRPRKDEAENECN